MTSPHLALPRPALYGSDKAQAFITSHEKQAPKVKEDEGALCGGCGWGSDKR